MPMGRAPRPCGWPQKVAARSVCVACCTSAGANKDQLGAQCRAAVALAVEAWLPKATVQAAIGATALDEARKRQLVPEEGWGEDVLGVAVLSILLTAPVGAVLIAWLGPLWLDQKQPGRV